MGTMNNENAKMVQVIDIASITADGDVFGAYFPQKSKITGVKLVNGAGISQSDVNFAVITLKNGATVLATHSTALTGGTGALVANTPAVVPLASAQVVNGGVNVPAGAYLNVNYDETGTYAMTSAKVIVEYFPL